MMVSDNLRKNLIKATETYRHIAFKHDPDYLDVSFNSLLNDNTTTLLQYLIKHQLLYVTNPNHPAWLVTISAKIMKNIELITVSGYHSHYYFFNNRILLPPSNFLLKLKLDEVSLQTLRWKFYMRWTPNVPFVPLSHYKPPSRKLRWMANEDGFDHLILLLAKIPSTPMNFWLKKFLYVCRDILALEGKVFYNHRDFDLEIKDYTNFDNPEDPVDLDPKLKSKLNLNFDQKVKLSDDEKLWLRLDTTLNFNHLEFLCLCQNMLNCTLALKTQDFMVFILLIFKYKPLKRNLKPLIMVPSVTKAYIIFWQASLYIWQEVHKHSLVYKLFHVIFLPLLQLESNAFITSTNALKSYFNILRSNTSSHEDLLFNTVLGQFNEPTNLLSSDLTERILLFCENLEYLMTHQDWVQFLKGVLDIPSISLELGEYLSVLIFFSERLKKFEKSWKAELKPNP